MPTTLAKIDLINMALSKIGAQSIDDIDDTENTSAIEARINWQLAVAEVGRAHAWNCLMEAVQLSATPQTPITPATPTPSSTAWAPATAYAAGEYVTYGGALYQALIANTSSASFINDLTQAFWFETDLLNVSPFDPWSLGSQYASGWAYQYPLPDDCLLLVTVNDTPYYAPATEYEIIGINLYTNIDEAIIKYVKFTEDTTRYDPLFAGCVVLMLASKMATRLRQDDANIATNMTMQYMKALSAARTKDAGERKPRRFNPIANSLLIASRYGSTNS